MNECKPDPKPAKKKRKKPEKMPLELRNQILERDDWTCSNPYCDGHIYLEILWLEIHHTKKRSQGGRNDPGNLMTICKPCHDKIHVEGKLKVSGVYPYWKFEFINKKENKS